MDGKPCCAWIGTDGAGHFVKMVHNGIEYADMQVIGEAFDLLRSGAGIEPAEQAKIFAEWNKGELASFLIEISAEVLGHVDTRTGKPFVDVVVDAAGQKGTGRWTVISALELGSPTSGIAESVFARALSSQAEQRKLAQELLAGEEIAVDVPETFVEDVRQALYASKLVSYAQGLDMLTSAAKEYGWDLKLDEIASLWRGGCIIRAELLKEITKAYAADEKPANLLFAPAFTKAIADVLPAWRRVVATAVQLGIPVPVFSSSLAYYDGLRRKRLPAAVIQGQRDLFGAHTYGRVDAEGTFHTLWGEDKSEIEAVDTH
ncbi:6-phosphogluconate dehydrogenase, decarboxylating [compost metagenome]